MRRTNYILLLILAFAIGTPFVIWNWIRKKSAVNKGSMASADEFNAKLSQARRTALANLRSGYSPEVQKASIRLGCGLRSNLANLLLAQWAVESGKGTNTLAAKANNLFSMRFPTVRSTTAIGVIDTKSGRFAVFTSPSQCVADLFEWFKYNRLDLDRLNSLSVPEYVALIASKRFISQQINTLAQWRRITGNYDDKKIQQGKLLLCDRRGLE